MGEEKGGRRQAAEQGKLQAADARVYDKLGNLLQRGAAAGGMGEAHRGVEVAGSRGQCQTKACQ